MKLKCAFLTLFVVQISIRSLAADCQLSATPSGLVRIEMDALKERELMPSYAYKCNDNGDKSAAGTSLCLQMVYCPHQLSGCYPSASQGSVFRMSPSGEILDRYPINVDKAGDSKNGKTLYADDTVNIKDKFCPMTKVINVKAIVRFRCLCEQKNCKKSQPLDLYTYANFPNLNNQTDDQLRENAITNGKAEFEKIGRQVKGYFPFNSEQSQRLKEVLNGQSPIRSCKDNYEEVSRFTLLGHTFLSALQKKGLVCSNTTDKDFVLLPQFSNAIEDVITPGGENIDGKSDFTGEVTFNMIQQARKSLGGCFPNPDSIKVLELKPNQLKVPETRRSTR